MKDAASETTRKTDTENKNSALSDHDRANSFEAVVLPRSELENLDRNGADALRQKAVLIEMSYDPIFVWESDKGIVDWNRGAEKLYGYTRDEAVGRISHELLKTRHSIPTEDFHARLRENAFWSGELLHETKDGRTLVIESRQQVIRSGDKDLVLEINRDISERKRSEALLERYRLLSEKSRDPIWFLTETGDFVEVNEAAIGLYGYSRDEFLMMNLRQIRHPSTWNELPVHLRKAKADVDGINYETIHVKKDGTALPVDVSANGADFGNERLIFAIVRDVSDRRRQEDALRESEERRKLAQEAGRVGIWDWDAGTNQTYWSETMWSFYDEPRGENGPIHEFWLSHIHPSDRERVDIHIGETLSSKSLDFHDEFRIIKKNGGVRWLESIAKIVRDESDRAVRMYGVNLDITDRKDSEERLRLSENQLRLVTNAVPALISYVDSNECYRFVNQQFNDWFGIPAEEVVGKSVREILDPRSYRAVKPEIDRAMKGQQVNFEAELHYQVAGDRFVHVSYMPDIGVDGTVYGYYGLTNDMTELKRSKDMLRSTEDRMTLMVENVTDYAVVSTDEQGLIDSWNTGAELIFRFSSDEIIGRPIDTLFTPEDIAAGIPLMEMKLARQKGRASDERWHIRKDGTRFFASGVMIPLYLGEKLTGYAKIASDLTEKKRRAEELQRAHDELEIRVKERTRELAESNLALVQQIEDRKIAEQQRIELLGRLVASQEIERRRIARDIHDQLGQRLTALRLKIASLKELSAGHEEISQRVERLQEIGENLDSEVNFIARELRPTALDDLGLVEAVGAFVHEWSNHYEIPADFHANGMANLRLPRETDSHFYRITQEALNNVVKHAEASMVTVVLERRGSKVVLIVEDNGKGFDVTQPSVLDASSGLGLVGMRERSFLSGGELEIESAPGRGTTIYVRVPVQS